MGELDAGEGPTCRSCGTTLSWRIVRDLTATRDVGSSEVTCPACRHTVEIDSDIRS